MQNRDACLWILSSVFRLFLLCGSHSAEAYSNIGRTNDVYATALMWVEHLFQFLLITPSVC